MSNGREVVLVTGGNGLIGRATCERLAERYQVVSLDVKEAPRRVPNVDFVEMDVSSPGSVRKGLDEVARRHGNRVASVIHLAAYYSFSNDPSPMYDKITVRGTESLLRELKARMNVEQFVFSSTILVHAPASPGHKIDENRELAPQFPYPKSKVDAESAIRREHGDIPFVILRIAGVYDDSGHSLPIAHQIERIYEHYFTGRFYPGPLSTGQSFVHLDDLVDAIARTVVRRNELPKELALLIGEPEVLGYGELQDRLAFLIHGTGKAPVHLPRTVRIPKAVAKAGTWLQEKVPIGEEPFIKSFMVDMADDHYDLDISRARRFLGWDPKHSLGETLPRMVDLLKRNPALFYRINKLPEPSRWGMSVRKNALSVLAGALILAPLAFFLARGAPRHRTQRYLRRPGERVFRRAG